MAGSAGWVALVMVAAARAMAQGVTGAMEAWAAARVAGWWEVGCPYPISFLRAIEEVADSTEYFSSVRCYRHKPR